MKRALAFSLISLFACSQQLVDVNNLACADGACLKGYVCHPETDLCVPEITVGCASGPDAVCPADVVDGTPCSSEGVFIPCTNLGPMDCSEGCRTCVNGTWSECSAECTLGEVTSCTSCSDDCTTAVLNATPVCDTTGVPHTCSYDARVGCQGGYLDADAEPKNGCECLPAGAEVACNDVDENCDGADRTEEGTLANCAGCGDSCEGLPHVATPACAGSAGSYACAILECVGGWANQDASVSNGCETTCIVTNGGVETCDGLDNDCNGLVDDAIADVQADCDGLVGHGNVDTWACSDGACAVVTCDLGFWDLDGLGSSGCEYACTPSADVVETCDGYDNDCNGTVDDVADVFADCNEILSDPDDVTSYVCEEAACNGTHCCRISACEVGKADVDQIAATGCEEDCTYAGAEICDQTDNDCNGVVDDAPRDATGCVNWYLDVDGDGFGVTGDTQCWCDPVGTYRAAQDGDCADADPYSYPGASEICDGNDNDCSGAPEPEEADDDGDHRVECSGWTDPQNDHPDILGGSDCDDDDPASYPGATELCDGNNNSCSGAGVSEQEIDGDGDHYVECIGWSDVQGDDPDIAGGNDCADGNPAINPAATEQAGDEVDQNCDGQEVCYLDEDEDGYRPGDGSATINSADTVCDGPHEAGSGALTGDCADGDPAIHPGATEGVADGVDQDCDTDELCYRDGDDDGVRPDATSTTVSDDLDCDDAYEAIAFDPTGDCQDGDPTIYPGANEVVADGIDQDCDTEELCYLDDDEDGYRPGDGSTTIASTDLLCDGTDEATGSALTGDCADDNPAVNPGAAEVCNNRDDDCDGVVDGDPPLASCQCAGGGAPAGAEACGDGIDNDCNDAVDDGCLMMEPSNLGAVDLCQNPSSYTTGGPTTIDTGITGDSASFGSITGVASPVTMTVAQGGVYPEIMVFFFDSITINHPVTVTGTRALALVACTTLTVTAAGDLDLCADTRGGGPGGYDGGTADAAARGPAAGGHGNGTGRHWDFVETGGGGGGHCGAGGSGGDARESHHYYLGGAGGGAGAGSAELIPLIGGSGGGRGQQAYGLKEGGGGGGAVELVAGAEVTIAGVINACGAGGGGPHAGEGDAGGGGGAGGGILLEAVSVTVTDTAVLAANGGGGGGGDNLDFNAPDSDTTGQAGPADVFRASGGTGSSGGGDGGPGGALSGGSINGDDGTGDLTDMYGYSSGGGGGGAGYIRINAETHDIDSTAVTSPSDAACFSIGGVTYQ